MTLMVLLGLLICSGNYGNKKVLSIEEEKTEIIESEANQEPIIPIEATAYKDECLQTIETLNSLLIRLENINAPFNVKNVLEPLNDFEILLHNGYSKSHLMASVHPDSTIREVASNGSIEFSKIKALLDLSRPVYEAVRKVNVSQADSATRRYHFLKMRHFKLSGVHKDSPTRKKIRQLKEAITEIGQEFNRNIQENVGTIKVTAEELTGLPEDFITDRKVDTDGLITLTTHHTDLFPVLTFADNDDVRRKLYIAWKARAYPQNEDVLLNLLEKRHELAILLGYRNYAELVTAGTMVRTPENAAQFIDKLYSLVKPTAENDITELLSKLQEIDPNATEVNLWQIRYLKEKIRKDKYKLNAKEVRKYFSYNNVKDGIFQLVRDLFGVEIQPWITEEVWHPSVESYKMLQAGTLIGLFYMDMHPREGKFQHAAGFTTKTGIAGRQLPVHTLVCNFPGEKDPGALMEHKQVKTFLHEFGHLIHALFAGHHHWGRISGIKTERDFVETPSQMLEEWIWDLETLQTFAVNAQGEPIPAELVEKMNQAKMFGKGVFDIGQLYLSALSLQYHLEDPANFDIMGKMLEVESLYSMYPHLEYSYFFANFGHLNNYSAIYYTYLWSKVIATDMFSEFEKYGIRNKVIAARYRNTVLSMGGMKPAEELVKDFLGRNYNFNAFAKKFRK